MKEPFLFLRSNQMYRFGHHQNVWFSLSYFVTLGKILLIECNQWATPWIQCNDQTASPSQCPKWPLKHCKIGFLMVLFISFLYCIEILWNFVISSIFVCVLLCRTQFSTVWNISLSFRLWIFMQIRRHGIYNRCCSSPYPPNDDSISYTSTPLGQSRAGTEPLDNWSGKNFMSPSTNSSSSLLYRFSV